MYYVMNRTNGWRSEERYETIAEAREARCKLIDEISHTALMEHTKPEIVIVEEPINEILCDPC